MAHAARRSINSIGGPFKDGQCSDPAIQAQLELVGRQVVEFARLRIADPATTEVEPPHR